MIKISKSADNSDRISRRRSTRNANSYCKFRTGNMTLIEELKSLFLFEPEQSNGRVASLHICILAATVSFASACDTVDL